MLNQIKNEREEKIMPESKIPDLKDIIIIGGTGPGNHDFDKKILNHLNQLCTADWGGKKLKFTHLDNDDFPDEPDLRIADADKGIIKNKHVIILESVYNQELQEEMLTLIYACKYQYKAKSVTVVASFLRYRRQEREDRPKEINRNKMLIHFIKAAGADRLILTDIHSDTTLKYCEAEKLEAWNVDPSPVFAEALKPIIELSNEEKKEFFLFSPDEGSVIRCVNLAKKLKTMEFEIKIALVFKNRSNDREISIKEDNDLLKKLQEKYPDVTIVKASKKILKGAIAAVREDELQTGSTGTKIGWKSKNEFEIAELIFLGTHGVCSIGWKRKFIDGKSYDRIYLGNTIPRDYKKSTGGKINSLDMSEVNANKLFIIMHHFDEKK